jgi:predicted unusual protein kinase regulating ubiquinone biosynthesis (AarF/ABC1/UbiB family)
MSISQISAMIQTRSASGTEMRDLFQSMAEGLQKQEMRIRDSIAEGLRQDSNLGGIPDYMRKQFDVWDQTYTGGEERKLVEELKSRIMELTANNEAYMRDQAQQKTAQFQLELAMKAANKTTSGIQQLLSAQ